MTILEGQIVCWACGECKPLAAFAKAERKCRKCRTVDRGRLKAKARAQGLVAQPSRKVAPFCAAAVMRKWMEPVNRAPFVPALGATAPGLGMAA